MPLVIRNDARHLLKLSLQTYYEWLFQQKIDPDKTISL